MSTSDELAELRRLLEALRSGAMHIRQGAKDVTRREHDLLERAVTRLDLVISRARRRER
jgi:hypothetical protein